MIAKPPSAAAPYDGLFGEPCRAVGHRSEDIQTSSGSRLAIPVLGAVAGPPPVLTRPGSHCRVVNVYGKRLRGGSLDAVLRRQLGCRRGAKLATMKDVAKKACVSVATVSHVVNGTRPVAPETEARVRQAMTDLAYEPNSIAQSLRTKVTKAVGILVSDITNPFFASVVRGAEDLASQSGYSIIVCNTDETPEKEEAYVALLRRRQLDGIIVVPVVDQAGPVLRDLPLDKRPFVFLDRRAKGVEADAVLSDNVGGAYQATQHLLKTGHRRIGIVLGLPGATTSEERLRGYTQALNEAGIALDKQMITWGRYRIDGGRAAIGRLLESSPPPTAVFTTNNLMTLGAIRELLRRGVAVPKSMALIGFDDPEWAELSTPPITTVAQDPYSIGFIGMEMLVKRIEDTSIRGYRELRVPVELRVRGTA